MAYTVTVVGSYPRPPHEGGEFRLRKTLQAIDRGEATADDVRAAEDDLVREIVAEQAAAGVELATDGQVRWEDALTPFAEGLEGFSVSGLLRFFDNNTYFRQPVVKGPVGRPGPFLVEAYRFAAANAPVPVKPVLTGPYTLAVLSKDEHYGDRAALVRDLATALNAEARDLVAAGATTVQFDEPALARVPGQPPGELDVFAAAAPTLVDGLDVTTVLATYFGDVAAHGAAFFDLPFGVFALDLIAGPGNEDALGDVPTDRALQAGIVDARNTRVETLESLSATVRGLEGRVAPDRLLLAPSSGLEYLPREAAERKLRRLGELKEALS